MLKVLKANNTEQLEEAYNQFEETVEVLQVELHAKEPYWLYVYYAEKDSIPSHIRILSNGRYFNEETKKLVSPNSWK